MRPKTETTASLIQKMKCILLATDNERESERDALTLQKQSICATHFLDYISNVLCYKSKRKVPYLVTLANHIPTSSCNHCMQRVPSLSSKNPTPN